MCTFISFCSSLHETSYAVVNAPGDPHTKSTLGTHMGQRRYRASGLALAACASLAGNAETPLTAGIGRGQEVKKPWGS